ncbi:MAG: hypothetical protein WDN28_23515 [Chthoniobacter sp.]
MASEHDHLDRFPLQRKSLCDTTGTEGRVAYEAEITFLYCGARGQCVLRLDEKGLETKEFTDVLEAIEFLKKTPEMSGSSLLVVDQTGTVTLKVDI